MFFGEKKSIKWKRFNSKFRRIIRLMTQKKGNRRTVTSLRRHIPFLFQTKKMADEDIGEDDSHKIRHKHHHRADGDGKGRGGGGGGRGGGGDEGEHKGGHDGHGGHEGGDGGESSAGNANYKQNLSAYWVTTLFLSFLVSWGFQGGVGLA